jgi:hypothetical protein
MGGAFVNLHHAKSGLVDLYGEADLAAAGPAVLERIRSRRPKDDARRVRAEQLFCADQEDCPSPLRLAQQRATVRELMQVSYEAADDLHAQARGFRTVLVIATLVLTAVAVALCVVGALVPEALPLCFAGDPAPACPSRSGVYDPSAGDLSIVALLGLIGGSLSVMFTYQRLHWTTAPYDIPVALALTKLPSGAITSIVGLLLIRGDFVPGLGTLDNQGQILAWAVLLGFAQHLVTRIIDQRAGEVIASVPRESSPKQNDG